MASFKKIMKPTGILLLLAGAIIVAAPSQIRAQSTAPKVIGSELSEAEKEALEKERRLKALINKEFVAVAKGYLSKKMPNASLWQRLARLYQTNRLSHVKQIHTIQMQADLLFQAGYLVIGATYAAEALKLAEDPLSHRFNRAWLILHQVSLRAPIQFILEDLAENTKLGNRHPPYFANDWNYIKGNALASQGLSEQAADLYGRINMSSRYFMPARYQLGMIRYQKGEAKEAIAALRSILQPATRTTSPLPAKDLREMWNYANMAIGRIKYEQKDFLDSARYYRKVTKTSPLFYDSLFEQSWSLFMSGNPKHALGSLYGSSSPFFEETNNPEVKVLESIVYFWMCRYGDARNSLADFVEQYSETMNSLASILEGQRLTPRHAYDLFENLIAGVSSQSLGIPREVLTTAATRDTMLLIRDQLATVMQEYSQLRKKGIFGSKYAISEPLERISKIRANLKTKLGEQFITEIALEKDRFTQLYSQAEFLYLELLMSEKEQLLGRELHAEMRVNKVSDYEDIRGWGRNTQSWKGERKGEFWWDEIGFHIVDAEPKCIEHNN